MNSVWQDIRYGARMLLRKLPVADPDRVVVIHNQLPKINLPRTQVSALQYLDYSRQTDAFASIALIGTRNFNLTGVAQPERLQAGRATASFFSTIGINPVAGRFFSGDEDKFGNEHVVVLSTALWKRLFASNAAAVNGTIQLNAENYKIVGVAPEGIAEIYPNVDLWMPMAFEIGRASCRERE